MSMSSRDTIVMDVRAALGATKRPRRSAEDIGDKAGSLLADADDARPALPSPDVVESFSTRVVGPKVNATLDRVSALAHLPEMVRKFLSASELGSAISLAPNQQLSNLDWKSVELDVVSDMDEGTYVAVADWAIAETGSVVLHSSSDTPILPNFLAITQIVVVPLSKIVSHLEDYFAGARAAGDPAPRNACLVTGPSGTSDIEGAFVRGAHGPRNVHIIIAEEL